MRLSKTVLIPMLLASSLFAKDESFVSNFTYVAGPGPTTGTVWVVSRGTAGSGVTLVKLSPSNDAISHSIEFTEQFPDSLTPVQDGVFTDVTAEHRRTPFANAGKLGFVVPLLAESDSGFNVPNGYVSSRVANAISLKELPTPKGEFPEMSEMAHATSALAYDSSLTSLFVARGIYGILKEDISGGINSPKRTHLVVNKKEMRLDSLKSATVVDSVKNPAVFGIAQASDETFYLATAGGLFTWNGSKLKTVGIKGLDSARATGVWIGGNPEQIIVETSVRKKSSTEDKLWRSYGGKAFAEVVFRDTAGKEQKNYYDKNDFTTSDVAFVGNKAFLSVQAVEGSASGLLKLDSIGGVPFDDDENPWLYGLNAGVVDRSIEITSVAAFPLTQKITGLVACTNGAGISVSADTGKTWTHIMNQTAVKDDLGSIRMVPSVIGADNQSLVSYKVSKPSKITIEVFSYDMRKVRTIVKGAERPASSTRSTLSTEDYWDGRDNAGRAVAMGIYYIRVKDNHGHVGWGKAITLGGK